MIEDSLTLLICIDEGLRLEAYRCPRGYWTIGWGTRIFDAGLLRALDAGGLLSIDERAANVMRDERLAEADMVIHREIPGLAPGPRHDGLVSMAYQLGPVGIHAFTMMLDAAREGRWEDAANDALDSKWARQTPERARRISEMIRRGGRIEERGREEFTG